MNASVASVSCLIIAWLGAIGWRLSIIVLVLTPKDFGELTSAYGEQRKTHPIQLSYEFVFILISMSFGLLSAFNLTLMCKFLLPHLHFQIMCLLGLNFAKSISTFQRDPIVERFRNIIISLQVLLVVGMIITFPISPAATIFLGAPYAVFLIIGFCYGQKRLIPLIVDLERGLVPGMQHKYDRLISNIRICSRFIFGGLFVFFAAGFLYTYYILTDWREYSQPNEISSAMAANEIVSFSSNLQLMI